jgi:lipopolysaccharide biosynthesis glycosyltransferase
MMSCPKFSTALKYPLFVAVNNEYIIHLLTMLLSFVYHNKDLISKLFVLSANRISTLNRLKFNTFGLIFNIKVNYIIINKSELNFQNKIHGHVGIEAFLRLFIPAYCPMEFRYALYLDSDLIINGSIVDFMDVNNMKRIIINAVEEVGSIIEKHKKELDVKKYFNSCVLCINI